MYYEYHYIGCQRLWERSMIWHHRYGVEMLHCQSLYWCLNWWVNSSQGILLCQLWITLRYQVGIAFVWYWRCAWPIGYTTQWTVYYCIIMLLSLWQSQWRLKAVQEWISHHVPDRGQRVSSTAKSHVVWPLPIPTCVHCNGLQEMFQVGSAFCASGRIINFVTRLILMVMGDRKGIENTM